MTRTHGADRHRGRLLDLEGATGLAGARPNPTSPISTRSLDMYLLQEELARAQIAERHAEMARSVRLARLAAARRRQRKAASAQRRLRLSLAPVR